MLFPFFFMYSMGDCDKPAISVHIAFGVPLSMFSLQQIMEEHRVHIVAVYGFFFG